MGTPTRDDDQIASYSSKGPTLIDHIDPEDAHPSCSNSTNKVAGERSRYTSSGGQN